MYVNIYVIQPMCHSYCAFKKLHNTRFHINLDLIKDGHRIHNIIQFQVSLKKEKTFKIPVHLNFIYNDKNYSVLIFYSKHNGVG